MSTKSFPEESMDADDALLRDYADSQQHRLNRIVMGAVAKQNEHPMKQRRAISRLALPLGAAAALVIALTFFFGGSRDLYADVVTSLAEASTFRATIRAKAPSGEWETKAEIVYQRDSGVRFEDLETGRIRIDNFQNLWRYNPSRKLALKSTSAGFAEEIVADILGLKELADMLDNEPIGEESFSGVLCALYRSDLGGHRYEILISQADQRLYGFRQFSQSKSDRWELHDETSIEYGIALDPAATQARFADDVTVLEPTDVAEAFKVDDALLTRDYFGLHFVFHEVQRIEGGRLLVCTSTRPSEDLIRQFGKIESAKGDGMKVHGNHAVGSSFTRFADGTHASFWSWEAAEVVHDGLQLKWTILTPLGDWPDEFTNALPLSVSIWTRGDAEKALKADQEDWYFNNRLVDTLDLSEFTANSLRGVLTDVYDQILRVEAGASHAVVNLQTKESDMELPNGRDLSEVVARKPSDINIDLMTHFIESELKKQDALHALKK